jgi:G3E family GTPase
LVHTRRTAVRNKGGNQLNALQVPVQTSTHKDPLAGKIPVTVITGFLGAGKTTLVARLLRHPAMDRVAVVINELGAIGIDHDLVSQVTESVALLANGCLCCSVRTDLQQTLRALFQDRVAGLIPEFDRVILETTGLADPAPVVQSLITDPLLSKHFFLDGVVTLVDAEHGLQSLQDHVESIKQVAIADLILITKSDRVSVELMQAVELVVAKIQPYAPQKKLLFGEIEPKELIGRGLSSHKAVDAIQKLFPVKLMADESLEASSAAQASRPQHRSSSLNDSELSESSHATQGSSHTTQESSHATQGVEGPIERTRTLQDAIRHPAGIRTFSLTWDESFSWEAFSSALELLSNLRGQDLLRVKGIVNIMGKPVVIQGVQHVFHPPVELDRWPSDNHKSRLVFIGRRLDGSAIRELFRAADKLRTD